MLQRLPSVTTCSSFHCSVCIATISTALCIGLMPMWFFFYSSTWSREFFIVAYPLDIAQYLVLIIVPVGVGMATRWCMPKVAKYIARVSSTLLVIESMDSPLASTHFFTFHRNYPIVRIAAD